MHWRILQICKRRDGNCARCSIWISKNCVLKFLSLILSQICLLGTSNMVDRNRSQGRLCRQRLLICKTLNRSWCKRRLVTVGPVMINCDQAGAKYRDHRSRSGARAAHSAEWAASAWPGPEPGAVGGVGGDSDSTQHISDCLSHTMFLLMILEPNNPLIFAIVLLPLVLAGGPISRFYYFERMRIFRILDSKHPPGCSSLLYSVHVFSICLHHLILTQKPIKSHSQIYNSCTCAVQVWHSQPGRNTQKYNIYESIYLFQFQKGAGRLGEVSQIFFSTGLMFPPAKINKDQPVV